LAHLWLYHHDASRWRFVKSNAELQPSGCQCDEKIRRSIKNHKQVPAFAGWQTETHWQATQVVYTIHILHYSKADLQIAYPPLTAVIGLAARQVARGGLPLAPQWRSLSGVNRINSGALDGNKEIATRNPGSIFKIGSIVTLFVTIGRRKNYTIGAR
jgi:hypothetical protein